MAVKWLKWIVKQLFRVLYRVDISGMEHYRAAGDRVLIIANHTSFLDGIFMALFLPDRLGFVINTHIARLWWVKPFLWFVDIFVLDHTRPYPIRSVIKYVRSGKRAVIFPEGRITLTGSLMKVYQGSGLAADRCQAVILPVRIDGAQYTPLSRLEDQVRIRWFPRISMTIMPPQSLQLPEHIKGRARRDRATRYLSELMSDMVFKTSLNARTLNEALLIAREVHGKHHIILDDINRHKLDFDTFLGIVWAWSNTLSNIQKESRVGLLMGNSIATAIVFYGLQWAHTTAVMIDFNLDGKTINKILSKAGVTTVYISMSMLRELRRERIVEQLGRDIIIIDVDQAIQQLIQDPPSALSTRLRTIRERTLTRKDFSATPAVVLFVRDQSGEFQERVYSQENLLVARQQIVTRFDFKSSDVMFCAWPPFCINGLLMGLILPILSGIKSYCYPVPERFRIVSELIYDAGTTLITAPESCFAGYVKFAHAYDMYNVRYAFLFNVVAIELLTNIHRRFGVRIMQGYSDVMNGLIVSINTPIENKWGSLGKLLPGIELSRNHGKAGKDVYSLSSPSMPANTGSINMSNISIDHDGYLIPDYSTPDKNE